MPPTAVPMMQPESESVETAAAERLSNVAVVRRSLWVVDLAGFGMVAFGEVFMSRWRFYISMRQRQGGS